MRLIRIWIASAVLLMSVTVLGQTSSSLTGRATMDGNAIPGVTVTISSPSMQGTRLAVTDVNGNYNFAAVPPGEYTLRFEMENMQPVTRKTRVGLGQTGRADAELRLSQVAEAITVTATSPAVLETTEVQSNFDAEFVDNLPMQRNFQAQANLAPNVTINAPSPNQLVISGAPAHENLYMVNGAVINENLRGQIHNLFIEDAIQETTVLTGAISAEYGRFTGGVVNSITKSGGNDFSGSVRDSLTNPAWSADSFEGQAEPTDKISPVYEATFGGRIIRDRVWFFTAGRYSETTSDEFLYSTSLPFPYVEEETRLEGKLTAQVSPAHSVMASYLDLQNPEGPVCFAECYEPSNVDPHREVPNSFLTAHYSGIFTSNFLGEINYSKKKFTFEGSGGDFRDPVHGTWGYDYNEGAFFGAPVFCGVCGPEERNNNYLDAKATYYLASRALGTHSVVAGYQDWAEQRVSNNYQSGSNYGIYVFSEQTPLSSENSIFRPVIAPGDWITYWPINELTKGSDFATRSFYFNDKWDLNNHWQFNVGLRYDKNNGRDASGVTRADDSLFSPRLAAAYDVTGTGRLRFNASYGQYVAKVAESVGGGASGAGNPAYIFYEYQGPEISGLRTVDAFQRVFDWFDSVEDPNDLIFFAQFPGVNVTLPESLKSPNVSEWTLGVGTQLGRGFARLDLVSRDWSDFYAIRTTGRSVADPLNQLSDLQEIFTSNDFERTYRGATLQVAYPVSERLQMGGNYTWSETRGDVMAETRDNGPVMEDRFQYPEFRDFAQSSPIGFLDSDQTHKVRAWLTYDLPTAFGNFTFSALERFDSGTAYSALGTVNFITDPSFGYVSEETFNRYENTPGTVNYYFGDRGGFRWDDVNALDLSLNYRLQLGRAQLFVQPEVINVFNENGVILGGTGVLTYDNDDTLEPFNPFTEKPVEGVHYKFADTFGKPRNNALDYQLARTYRLSVGFRF